MELFSIRYQEEKVCFTVQDAARFLSVSNGCIYQLMLSKSLVERPKRLILSM